MRGGNGPPGDFASAGASSYDLGLKIKDSRGTGERRAPGSEPTALHPVACIEGLDVDSFAFDLVIGEERRGGGKLQQ